jgi:predicted flap endonuclease-1-like 5' DNA nuclease
MGYPIVDVEGIGEVYAQKLAKAGIANTNAFLRLCCDRTGRGRVARETGISETLILKWANLADLMRIKGIGPQYSELLEAAGVDTVKELRHRNAGNLAAKMKEVREEKRLTRVAPGASMIERWIAEAQRTEPLITH